MKETLKNLHNPLYIWAMVSPRAAMFFILVLFLSPAAWLVYQYEPQRAGAVLALFAGIGICLLAVFSLLLRGITRWTESSVLELLRGELKEISRDWSEVNYKRDCTLQGSGTWTKLWLAQCLHNTFDALVRKAETEGQLYLSAANEIFQRDLQRMGTWIERDHPAIFREHNQADAAQREDRVDTASVLMKEKREPKEVLRQASHITQSELCTLRNAWRDNFQDFDEFMAMCLNALTAGYRLEFTYTRCEAVGVPGSPEQLETIVRTDANGDYPYLLWLHRPFEQDEPKDEVKEGPITLRTQEPVFDLQAELRSIARNLDKLANPPKVVVNTGLGQFVDEPAKAEALYSAGSLLSHQRNFLVVVDPGKEYRGKLAHRKGNINVWMGAEAGFMSVKVNDLGTADLRWVYGLSQATRQMMEATGETSEPITLLEHIHPAAQMREQYVYIDMDNDPEVIASRQV